MVFTFSSQEKRLRITKELPFFGGEKIRRIDMETRKCAYCGAERPVNEMAERVLVHKCGTESGRTATVRTKNWYCSDTACDERHQDKEDSRQ